MINIDLKQYVRKGRIDESTDYKTICQFNQEGPEFIITLLEGKVRRKVQLEDNLYLYENYYAECFVGLEDQLLNHKRPGAAGVYPGSHYILWDRDDFLNAISIQPELARRAIFDLSRRIRIYDAHKHTTDLDLRQQTSIEPGTPDENISGALYEMSFAADDEFPAHLIDQLTRTFQPGDALMKQGEKTDELYIILKGSVDVFHQSLDKKEKIDTMVEGDMVGEMAQFDGLARSADVIANQTVTALEFTSANFHMLFQLHPRWARKLLDTLAERLELRRKNLKFNPE